MESMALKSERMKRIFRGKEAYGDGKPAAQAARYHFENLLPDIIELAKIKSGDQEPTDTLISLSGFSPATTILAFEILRPQRVLIIVSEESQESVDIIGQHIVGKCGLPLRKFKHRSCDPADTLSIYEIVKEELGTSRGLAPTRAVIDITGGKKVMSAAAALAAWQLNLPLCYIECDYDVEMRQPVAGTERLIWIENPAKFSGDNELDKTCEVFDSGRYDLAHDYFENLSRHISKPTFVKFMQALSVLYKKWCDLDLNQLETTIEKVRSYIRDPRLRDCLTEGTFSRIERQVEFLGRLLGKDPASTLINLYVLGVHYQSSERHDFAAMLFYRVVEGTLVLRLEQVYPDFKCKAPDYTVVSKNRDLLLSKFKMAAESAGLNVDTLPNHFLGYINAATLLAATEDRLFEMITGKGVANPLSRLHQLAGIRNNSLLAHGNQSVTGDESREIGYMAKTLLTCLCRLQGLSADLNQMIDDLKFVKVSKECRLANR
jgi:CRISPR-associated protein (TIGR02710 family)